MTFGAYKGVVSKVLAAVREASRVAREAVAVVAVASDGNLMVNEADRATTVKVTAEGSTPASTATFFDECGADGWGEVAQRRQRPTRGSRPLAEGRRRRRRWRRR